MTDPFPPQEVPAPTPPAPDPAPALPVVTFSTDRVRVQVIVARMQDGHKVAEIPCAPVDLLYPFDQLGALCEQMVQGVSQQSSGQ